MAPEIFPHLRGSGHSDQSYDKAVDIWSLGVMTFLILGGQNPFRDPVRLDEYVVGNFKLPLGVLVNIKVGPEACEFVKSVVAANPKDRPNIEECRQHPWLQQFQGNSDLSR